MSSIYQQYLYRADVHQLSTVIPIPSDSAWSLGDTNTASPEEQSAPGPIEIPDAEDGKHSQMSSGGQVDVTASPESVPPSTPSHLLIEPTYTDGIRCFAHADADQVEGLLPKVLATAVTKYHHPLLPATKAAGITMAFNCARSAPAVACQMSLEISAEYVESFATEFFDVEMNKDGGLRRIVLPKDAIVIPCPSITLRGSRPEAFKRLFGPVLWTGSTNQVYMVIPYSAEGNATLCVSLEIDQGMKLQKILYSM